MAILDFGLNFEAKRRISTYFGFLLHLTLYWDLGNSPLRQTILILSFFGGIWTVVIVFEFGIWKQSKLLIKKNRESI